MSRKVVYPGALNRSDRRPADRALLPPRARAVMSCDPVDGDDSDVAVPMPMAVWRCRRTAHRPDRPPRPPPSEPARPRAARHARASSDRTGQGERAAHTRDTPAPAREGVLRAFTSAVFANRVREPRAQSQRPSATDPIRSRRSQLTSSRRSPLFPFHPARSSTRFTPRDLFGSTALMKSHSKSLMSDRAMSRSRLLLCGK